MQGARSAENGRGREGPGGQHPDEDVAPEARRGQHRDEGVGREGPRGQRPDEGAGREGRRGQHPVITFLRANPQVLVLLVICLVLGLGTFLAVLFGLIAAGNGQTTGEPSGTVLGAMGGVHGAVGTLLGALSRA